MIDEKNNVSDKKYKNKKNKNFHVNAILLEKS